MRRVTRPSPSANRHGVRAEHIGYRGALPEFSTQMTWGARRGFEYLIGNRGVKISGQVLRRICVNHTDHPIPAIASAQLRVAVARSAADYEAAHHLVRKRYAWRGYDVETMADPRLARAHPRFEQEITFVAARHDATVGTVTLGLDGPYGLRAEETHGDVIRTKRASGCRVCELTRLAVDESVDSRSVLASLFGLAYAAGRTLHDVTDVFIEVNPRHVAYYSRILGFVVAAGERLCERVRAPSVLLHLEIDALAARLKTLADIAMPQTLLEEAA